MCIRDRHREAVRLLAAVAAALADALVDHDELFGLLCEPALALAAQLGRALLLVNEHGGARYLRENLLRLAQSIARPDFDAAGHALLLERTSCLLYTSRCV